MKLIFLFLIFFFSIDLYSQYDLRKVSWGMSKGEVKSSELPLYPTEESEKEIVYDKIETSDGAYVKLIYVFKNSQLIKATYIVYGVDNIYARGTCTNIISLNEKISRKKFIFDAITNKGAKCTGWYTYGCGSLDKSTSLFVDNYNSENIEKINNAAMKNGCEKISLLFEGERTDYNITFNEHQNYVSKNQIFKCNDNYFNTYFWLDYKANYITLNKVLKSDF